MKRRVLLPLTLFLLAPGARALEPTAVPDFTALSRWGEPVASRSLAAAAEARGPAAERWAFLYVPLSWNGWPELLKALEKAGGKASGRLAVVVGGASPGDLGQLSAQAEKAPGIEWLADGGEEVLRVLPATALPVAFGARGWAIDWAEVVGGRTPEALASLLADWVGR